MSFSRFSPSGRSKSLFVIAMTCYAYTGNCLVSRIVALFIPRIPSSVPIPWKVSRPILDYSVEALLTSPICESLVLIGMIELLRRLGLRPSVQLIISAVILCGLHSWRWLPWGFVVAPLFLLCAYSYLHWKSESWTTACLLTVLIRFGNNVIPVLDFIINKRNALYRGSSPS